MKIFETLLEREFKRIYGYWCVVSLLGLIGSFYISFLFISDLVWENVMLSEGITNVFSSEAISKSQTSLTPEEQGLVSSKHYFDMIKFCLRYFLPYSICFLSFFGFALVLFSRLKQNLQRKSDLIADICNQAIQDDRFSLQIRIQLESSFKALYNEINSCMSRLNASYMALVGWLNELKESDFSDQMSGKIKEIEEAVVRKIHIGDYELLISPAQKRVFSYHPFLLFIFYFEALFYHFKPYFIGEIIQANILLYFVFAYILVLFAILYMYSLSQNNKRRGVAVVFLCLNVIVKLSMGLELDQDQVMMLYILNIVFAFLSVVSYAFINMKNFLSARNGALLFIATILGFVTGHTIGLVNFAPIILFLTVFVYHFSAVFFMFDYQVNLSGKGGVQK